MLQNQKNEVFSFIEVPSIKGMLENLKAFNPLPAL